MANNARKASQAEPEVRCLACDHLEREHGTTGTPPCLTMVGDMMERQLCQCRGLRRVIRQAAYYRYHEPRPAADCSASPIRTAASDRPTRNAFRAGTSASIANPARRSTP